MESDVLGSFLDEQCQVASPLSCPASRLYTAYRDWAHKSGERVETQTAFGRALTDRGFAKHRTAKGYVYTGLNVQEVNGSEDSFPTSADANGKGDDGKVFTTIHSAAESSSKKASMRPRARSMTPRC